MIKIGVKEQAIALAETLTRIVEEGDEAVRRIDISQGATGEIRVTECRNVATPTEPIRGHSINWRGEVRSDA